MYSPTYQITNKILKNIGLIEGAREVVVNAPIVPAYEKKFREEAIARQVHYGTHLEGNDLIFPEAIKVVAEVEERNVTSADQISGVVGQERDIQEVVNYRRVMDYLDQLKSGAQSITIGNGTPTFRFTEEMLQQIHRLTVDKLIPPDQTGKYRTLQVTVRNSQTGEVFFRPPPAIEVPFLVGSVVDWLNSDEGRNHHPVIRAGVVHYDLASIHPYVEGNGRSARAFATLILFVEGYDIRRLFALEEFFDRHAVDYYASIATVSNQSPNLTERNLTLWLEFFTEALAIELTRIKDKVRELSVDSHLSARLGGRQIALSERELTLMEYLQANREMTMAEAKGVLTMVSEDTILRDLKDLMNKGIIKKQGVTKAARYILATT
jgi:Fic family protein